MPCSKREWLRRESNDRESSSTAPQQRQIELCSRHTHLEVRPACFWIRQNHRVRQAPVESAFRKNCDYLKDHRSAQYFNGITTDANIGNAFPFPRCPNVHLAWPTALGALPNHHLLIPICDAVLHHPTGSAACCRSCGRVFA